MRQMLKEDVEALDVSLGGSGVAQSRPPLGLTTPGKRQSHLSCIHATGSSFPAVSAIGELSSSHIRCGGDSSRVNQHGFQASTLKIRMAPDGYMGHRHRH